MRTRFRITLTLALLTTLALPTWAMTEAQAANNLMYLTGARNEALFCQQFGGKAMEALITWETKNKETFEKSTKTIEDFAVKSKKVSKEEAKVVPIGLMARLQQRDDSELAPKRTRVTCSKYAESLTLYEAKLAR
ncbi:MAG: hypothetical protein V4858_04375 [Pseudomonadota bacterium]